MKGDAQRLPPSTGPRARRRRLAAGLAAALVLAPIFAIAALAALGITIDGERFRDALAERASAALGRPVRLEGAITLTLARHAKLRVTRVAIGNPPGAGFADRDFATLGEAHAEVDLLPALRGELTIRRIDATDARLALERAPDGRANWALAPRAPPPAPDAQEAGGVPVALAVERLALRRLRIDFRDARSGRVRVLELDEAAGTGRRDAPLRLALAGRIEEAFPYSITVEGGPLDDLLAGDAPWPATLDVEFLQTRLHAEGTVEGGGDRGTLAFGMGTEDLAQVERFLGTRLPRFGVAALSGRVAFGPEGIAVDGLRGVLGQSEMTAALRLGAAGERFRLTGAIELATLDVRPFLEQPPADRALTFADVADRPLDVAFLRTLDAALAVRIGRWLGLPGEIADTALELDAAAGRLSAPMRATVAGVPLAGRLDVDASGATPAIALELGAHDSPLGGLATLLAGVPGIEGELGRFSLRASGRGATVGALVAALDARVEVARARLSYGNVEAGRPVAFVLDTLTAAIPPGRPLAARARGTLLGEPVTAKLAAGTLERMLRELGGPLDAELAGAGATLRITGTTARAEARGGSDLRFALAAPRAGTLARWLGVAPAATLPLSLEGRLRLLADEWHLEGFALKAGASSLALEAHRTSPPFIVASVASPLLDAVELDTLVPKREPAAAPARARTAIDIPILPARIDLADADIGVGLERVRFARTEIANAGFAARLRGGRMESSPFGAAFTGVPFSGVASLDLRGATPEFGIAMSTGATDVGGLLARLGLAEDLDLRTEAMQVELKGRGSRLGELAAGTALDARVRGGRLQVRDVFKRVVADIRMTEAWFGGAAGAPLEARIEGTLDAEPVTIRARTGTLASFAADASRVPFSLDAAAAGARLALDGLVALPLGRGGDLKLDLSGKSLDELDRLARVDLPPWGPYSVSGPFRMTPSGYEVRDLEVRVGSSRLTGRARFDVTGAKPRLDVALRAPRVQLDDFPLAQWSYAEAAAPGEQAPAGTSVEALRARAKDAADTTEAFLSAAFLRRLDASLDAEVEEVLSGRDRLASGRLGAQIVDGRLYVGPVEVNLPSGGTARASLSYEPVAGGVRLAAGAYVDRVDYGILARRIRPDTDLEGVVSLNLELAAAAPSLARVMEHADGRIDVAVWPHRLRSGVFDLWAVNVFLAALPAVDADADSRVNCAVARFDLRNGRLTQDALVIDTTRVRVGGEGAVDFATDALGFRLVPRAKRAQFFGLGTPVTVEGKLTDFAVGVNAADVLGTIAGFLGSVVVTPLQRLAEGPLPADGADVCADPLRRGR